MEVPDIVDVGREYSVLVRIRGPDPRGRKMRGHAFHHADSGMTALSASGFVVPDSFSEPSILKHVYGASIKHPVGCIVVTSASIVEPFLSRMYGNPDKEGLPKLVSGVAIDVLSEAKHKALDKHGDMHYGDICWLSAQFLALVDIPVSSIALQSLIGFQSNSHGLWEIGWSLSSSKDFLPSTNSILDIEDGSGGPADHEAHPMAKAATRVAFLAIAKDVPPLTVSRCIKKADLLVAIGSPFGVLSPLHFFNSVSVGAVANFSSVSACSSLLMADIRCLPGMEGAPVFDNNASLVGVLIRPLRQSAIRVEVQLVVPWDAITTALEGLLQNQQENHDSLDSLRNSSRLTVPPQVVPVTSASLILLGKASATVVLIAVGDGAWASGVVLNSKGLILTNAHLLEPWRFRKGSQVSGMDETGAHKFPGGVLNFQMGDRLLQDLDIEPYFQSVNNTSDKPTTASVDRQSKSYGRIKVRTHSLDPNVWYEARAVYVCRGPWDIALIQLEVVPNGLFPAIPDLSCPRPGSKVYIIGHGLFGPVSSLEPSVSSGVTTRVVMAPKSSQHSEGVNSTPSNERLPVMLETTAAVYPGGSGGGVFNSEGHLVGLVTSNARHYGKTLIPHLNFSIPCAALDPVFKIASDMRDISSLSSLDQPDEVLSTIWAMMPPPADSQTPSHVRDSILDKESNEKGSRFSKFIHEKGVDVFLKQSNPYQRQRHPGISRSLMPSKL